MPNPQKGENSYTKNVKVGARADKKKLQTIMNDQNATTADGFKLDIDLVANHPDKVPINSDILHEQYINKNNYSDKIDGLSSALQGELVCYVDEQKIINKIVENSNSKAFEKGEEATVTQADVQKAFDDQDDINLNVIQAQLDANDDLSIFDKFNGNLMALKFITKMKMLSDAADVINGENIKVSGPTTKRIYENYTESTSFCEDIDDKYRDEVTITVKRVDDPENNQTKTEVYKTTTRYIQILVKKYYLSYEKNAFNGGYNRNLYEPENIKKYEKLFDEVGLRDRIPYLKDSSIVD